MSPLPADPPTIVVTGRGLEAQRPAADITRIDRARILAAASGRLKK